MAFIDSFPSHKIEGNNYRIEKPEIEFHGLTGIIEGAHVIIREQGQIDRLADADELSGVLMRVREAFKTDIANGHSDHVGMVILPRVGGIALFRAGILTPTDFLSKPIHEEETTIVVPDIELRDPQMRPGQKMKIAISSELTTKQVRTATAEGKWL